MHLLEQIRRRLLRRRPVTNSLQRPSLESPAIRVDEIPPFNLRIADLMRFDPQVRIGLGARNGFLMGAQVDIVGDDQLVTEWVRRQWDHIWGTSSYQLLRTKLYGFLPLEVMYRETKGGPYDGAIEVDHLQDRHPRDVRVLQKDGQIVGFSMRSKLPHKVSLVAPKALVCTFDAEFGNPYGCALLERAYPAWYEKWMEGGVKKIMRLRMIKDAYIGDIFWYPVDRVVQLPSGETVNWRDIAREMLEARLSGGAMTLPLMYDKDGHKLMDYTPPQDVAGATHIFEWKRDVDLEIWKALEIPPEVIEASSSGSGFSGRSIPFTVALTAAQAELAELVRCIDRDILRPVAQLNFGREPNYDIRPRPLIETYRERIGAVGRVAEKISAPTESHTAASFA